MSWFKRRSNTNGSEKKSNSPQELLTASAEINQFEALPSGRHVYLQGSNEGAYNPLTWEGMPLTLQIKFPHWKDQKLSSSPKVERKESTEKLQSPLLKKPVASNESLIPYIVMECDTLPSIALKFDVNQGEIARVNNKVLGSSCPIYPGELLYIPDIVRTDDKVEDDKGVGDEGREDSDNNKVSEDIVKDESVQGTLEASSFSDEEEVSPDFIRIKSKFIPEQICIQGSLWLNPQSLMFRPDPNDPLVEDHGIASYEVLIPLSEIVYAFFSFNYSSSDLLSPTATLTTTTASTTAATISPSPVTEDDKSPSLSRSSPPHDLSSPPLDDLSSPHDIESFPNDDDDDDQCFEHILDPDQGPPHESNSSSSNLDQNGSRSDIEEQYGDSPKSLSGPWRFLYVRVSQSAQQNQLTPIVGIEIPSHHKSSHELFAVRTWFIFAVPAVRLSDIHDFIFNYHPLAKSDDNLASLSAVSQATLTDSNRLEIVNIHGQYADDDLLVNEGHFSSSWEIFSVKDFQPVKIKSLDIEDNLPLPHLLEESNFLNDEHVRKLSLNLVSDAVGHDWFLIYSTMNHGISLQTLYRNMANFGESPTILLIKDTSGKMFGAMLSCPIRVSERFYGTGESKLFSFDENDDICVYEWTGVNDYIIKGSTNSVAIGSGDGHFGLWFDEYFYHGSSLKCSTFNNEPLASSEKFIIFGIELWGFS